MRRQGHLIEKIADLENLELAFYKAQKGKSVKREVIEYAQNLYANLFDLQQQLLSGCVKIGNYHFFTIYDPKQRLICAAPFGQRVLHHALMNVCHPHFEKVQIYDSYACRIDKGTYAALERAKHYNKRHRWFLKLDFRKYFDSIDHIVLKRHLGRFFKDGLMLNILADIIDSYSVSHHKGVPIGNLTSQYFANHYLAPLDHYIKEILRIKAYVRYMDDLALWHDDKEILKKAGMAIEDYSAHKLALILKPFCMNQSSYGLPFLGYLIYPDRIRLAHRSVNRFVKKLRTYEYQLHEGMWDQQQYQKHVLPLIAFTEHADAKEFRKRLISKF
ncbi:RNA-directed DNA polymerase [candidate division KSB1 bacterium]|nr:RNA-directed DNA polymerase [candidate division KSB1 bacterium]